MKTKSIKAYAIIKKRTMKLNANGIFHAADREYIIVSKDELLIPVTITPIEKNTTEKRDKPDEKEWLQKNNPYLKEIKKAFGKASKKKVSKPAKKRAR